MDLVLAPNRTDYYRMLGLDPSAPLEAVQGAYKILARRLHPDVAKDPISAQAMTRANNIYQALVERPVPSEFQMAPAPVVRRSQIGTDPLARYRQSMTMTEGPGQLVDVFA